MALSESAVSELLDAFRTGKGVDLVRDAVQLVLQALIEVEATEVIGAARYQRTDSRVTERNGSRGRLLAAQGGDVELRIPKLRKGSFFPAILEPRRQPQRPAGAAVANTLATGRRIPHRARPDPLSATTQLNHPQRTGATADHHHALTSHQPAKPHLDAPQHR